MPLGLYFILARVHLSSYYMRMYDIDDCVVKWIKISCVHHICVIQKMQTSMILDRGQMADVMCV